MVVIKKRPEKQSSKPIYFKSFSSDVKVKSETRTISGYAAIWNNIDDAGDVLLKGCCSKSIAERGPESTTNRKIIFLWMHNMEEPLGKITKLLEDEKGLYFEAVVDSIPEGDRCLEQLKSGTLNQFSIGYAYIWDKCQWEEITHPDDPTEKIWVRYCKELSLWELSVVSLGCNEETGFEGIKNLNIDSERNKLMRDTEKALKLLPYETQLQIKQLISKHIALAEYQPGKPTEQPEPPTSTNAVDFKQLFTALKTN